MAMEKEWTPKEEKALKLAVEAFGERNWKRIKYEPFLSLIFSARSEDDLKDKWESRLKWALEEEEALQAGVNKYGVINLDKIKVDPEFGRVLSARSLVDLRDKWWSMRVATFKRPGKWAPDRGLDKCISGMNLDAN